MSFSYCRTNGKALIWLLVTAHRLSASTKSELRRLHTSYPNLMVAHLDIEVVLSGTPLIDIIHDENFYESGNDRGIYLKACCHTWQKSRTLIIIKNVSFYNLDYRSRSVVLYNNLIQRMNLTIYVTNDLTYSL